VITALVTASGPLGLSAFFPPVGLKYKTDADDQYLRRINYLPPPHLPLTSTWQEADFSLKSVLSESSLPGEPVNLRRWTMQLLFRYLYISGRSPSHFHMAKSPQHVSSVFQMVDNAKDVRRIPQFRNAYPESLLYSPQVALLGFNDDIETDYELTRSLMIEWFEKRWPEPAVWEKNWKPKGKGYWTG
jgi:3-O-alpha-D-mannopyranosyl-alpha-D-mannopyranose xylosylphosphotransferase